MLNLCFEVQLLFEEMVGSEKVSDLSSPIPLRHSCSTSPRKLDFPPSELDTLKNAL